MVVNHLQGHSNNAISSNRSKKSDKKSGNFEDMLTQSLKSKKKKAPKKVARKTPVSKKRSADINDNDQVQHKMRRSASAKDHRQTERVAQRTSVNQKKPLQKQVQPAQMKNSKVAQLQKVEMTEKQKAMQADILGKQASKDVSIFENQNSLNEIVGGKKTEGLPLSKNSSESLEKTLNLNEKKLVQDLQAKQLSKDVNVFTPNNQVKKAQKVGLMQKPDFKIDPNPGNQGDPASELMENLESLKSKLNDLAKDQKGLSQDNGTQLDSTFTQAFEAEGKVDAADKSFFAEKLAEIDGQAMKSEKVENVNSIIKQARAFIKDGGGEMQIELQPEGLGKIQLKVAVENGKAQVEMFADNKLAKTALEDSLAEMKLGLENQRLIVDHLKVEMSNDYERDFSQLKDNLMEQEQREFARQFLNQFRDEKNERWDGMFSGFRNYARSGERPELSLQPNNQQRALFGANKGRGLNIVA